MTKALDVRLRDAKATLDQINNVLARRPGILPADFDNVVRSHIACRADIDHWLALLEARHAARTMLVDLETGADANDCVLLGTARVKFQHVRLLTVQGYLTTGWALSDRITGMVGRLLCTPDAGSNSSKPAQLVSHFVNREGSKKSTAASLFESVRQSFGWPVGIAYAIRNHFVHDGAQLNGSDFFDGTAAASGFRQRA